MTDATPQPEDAPTRRTESGDRAHREAERRRRRARVFGDVLPDGTSDERDDWGGGAREGGSDDWLRRQVPPHHG